MASDKGASRDILDERLAQARDSILLQDEEIVAQAMGDSGQAVVLTKSRVLVLKVGLNATGEFGGQRTAAHNLEDITAVNVRKGPLGAVIQICTADPKQSSSADNIIVFSGDAKVKKCEAIAAKIAGAIGKNVAKFGHDSIQEQVQNAAAENAALNVEIPPVDIITKKSSKKKSEPAEKPEDVAQAQEQKAEEQTPPAKRKGREARSLAEEMFADMYEPPAETKPVEAELPKIDAQVEPVQVPDQIQDHIPEPEPVNIEPAVVSAPIIEDINTIGSTAASIEELMPEPQTQTEPAPEVVAEQSNEVDLQDEAEEALPDFVPNPRLPKPVRRSSGSGKPLVLLGVLAAVMIVGMAIISPHKQVAEPAKVTVNVEKLTHSAPVMRRQYVDVTKYRSTINKILESSDRSTASLKAALMSGSRQSIMTAASNGSTGKACDTIGKLKAPTGLAGAKECLVSGLFARETAAANLAASIHSASAVNSREALNKLAEADSNIKRGLDAIDNMLANLKADVSKANSRNVKKQ